MTDTPGPRPKIIGWLAAAAIMLLSMRIVVQGGWTPYLPSVTADLNSNVSNIITGVIIRAIEQALRALPIVGAMWLAAAGYGFLVTSRLCANMAHRRTIQCGSGLAVLLQLNWLLAWAGWLNRATAFALLGFGIAIAVWQIVLWFRRQGQQHEAPRLPWPLFIAIPGVALLCVAATVGPGSMWRVEAWGYDVLAYHLQLPREWIANGHMSGLHHNVYSYLPSFIETGYMLIGVLRGSMYDGIITTQMFHASAAIAAALTIARVVQCVTTHRYAAWTAGALMLTIPWPIITGSMAYDEMFAMLFGACALLVIVQREDKGAAAAAGILVGAATLTKLTAGLMFAAPVGLIFLMGIHRRAIQPRVGAAAMAAIVGAMMLVPYMARNAADTGNPVFPFATSTLGRGHWTPDLADRWNRGHHVEENAGARCKALAYQWLCNTGYGAAFGRSRVKGDAGSESRNIARFDTEWGLPLLWLAVLAAGVAAARHGPTRRLAAAMGVMLIVQILFWLTATHLQSRFLIYTLLPAFILLGIGFDRLHIITHAKAAWAMPAAAIALAVSFTLTSYNTAFAQVQMARGERIPMWYIAGGLPTLKQVQDEIDAGAMPGPGDHFLNRLPPDAHVMLVADNARLLYIRRPFTYNSAFDINPLGEVIRATDGDPQAVTAALRAKGITHLWVHWPELTRLSATYGFDDDVTPEALLAILRTGCRVVWQTSGGDVQLVELPRQ